MGGGGVRGDWDGRRVGGGGGGVRGEWDGRREGGREEIWKSLQMSPIKQTGL